MFSVAALRASPSHQGEALKLGSTFSRYAPRPALTETGSGTSAAMVRNILRARKPSHVLPPVHIAPSTISVVAR